jgi:hypothetical protein
LIHTHLKQGASYLFIPKPEIGNGAKYLGHSISTHYLIHLFLLPFPEKDNFLWKKLMKMYVYLGKINIIDIIF